MELSRRKTQLPVAVNLMSLIVCPCPLDVRSIFGGRTRNNRAIRSASLTQSLSRRRILSG
jgi:hypothetical protein